MPAGTRWNLGSNLLSLTPQFEFQQYRYTRQLSPGSERAASWRLIENNLIDSSLKSHRDAAANVIEDNISLEKGLLPLSLIEFLGKN